MGMFDNMKDKAEDLASEHPDQVNEGLDKVGDFANEKTGGKFEDQIDKGQDFARDRLEGDDQQDDNQS
ncbi:MAG TPA: antitoxin [Kribbella sp.]